MTYKFLRSLVYLGFINFFVSPGWATKPEVSIPDCVRRAEIIATVQIVTSSKLSNAIQDKDGKWSFERYRLVARVKQLLKGSLSKQIVFECEGLTFEKTKDYVVFLKSDNKQDSNSITCIDSPNRLVESTYNSQQQIQRIIEQQAPHNQSLQPTKP